MKLHEVRNWNDIQRQGAAFHAGFERVLSAKRRWRAIARALGFTRRAIRMLAKAKKNDWVFVDVDSGMRIDGSTDFVRLP